jgi:hypothetical protein
MVRPIVKNCKFCAALLTAHADARHHPICRGQDFLVPSSNTMDALMSSMLATGFQATNVGLAVKEICRMRSWLLSEVPWREGNNKLLHYPAQESRVRAHRPCLHVKPECELNKVNPNASSWSFM